MRTTEQIIPFTLVGIISTGIHLLLVYVMVRFFNVPPLIANTIAYGITVHVSYLGHRYVTFAHVANDRYLRYCHYAAVSILAFLLNEFLYFLCLYYLPIHYFVSLMIVIILVAIFTFVASKWWACR